MTEDGRQKTEDTGQRTDDREPTTEGPGLPPTASRLPDPSSVVRLPVSGGRLLLIGDISKVLLDAAQVSRYPCEVRASLLEGIDAAARGQFAAVGIVMEGTTHQLAPALRALREGTPTRILLLAQMHEEPIARRLVAAGADERRADTYLVCPTCLASLCTHAGVQQGTDAGEPEEGKKVRTEEGRTAFSPAELVNFSSSSSSSSLLSSADLAALEARIRYLERLATTDDLTGLKNRRYIWEFARQILEHAGRTQGRVTLLVFDIDNFKHYNDVYGHLIGDEILRQAAVLMRRCCRSHDVVGRIGGDEFAVIFWDDPPHPAAPGEEGEKGRTGEEKVRAPEGGTAISASDLLNFSISSPLRPPRQAAGGVPSGIERRANRERGVPRAEHPREVLLLAQRFQKEFGRADLPRLGPGGEGILTISGGLAGFPCDGATVQQLFERADLALRDAKGNGKNRIYLVGEPQGDIGDLP